MTMTLTQAQKAPARMDAATLRDMLRQIGSVGSVELKLTVPTDQRMALRALQADPLAGRIREVTYFDTPDLDLFRAGVVVRARRTQNKDDDTVVKLRPVTPADLDPKVAASPNLKLEMDVTRGSFVISASLKGVRKAGAVAAVTAKTRSLEQLLSKEQRAFLIAHFPVGVSWTDLVPLGPIYVVALKVVPSGFPTRMTIEQWHYPGQVPLVELSTKATPADAAAVHTQAAAALQRLGFRQSGPQEPKTRKALEYFARGVPASDAS